jgi:hypothetical protein
MAGLSQPEFGKTLRDQAAICEDLIQSDAVKKIP